MIKEEVKVKKRNISLILDGYSDIFSDFDPRPFSERTLSDDFIQECKRASFGKEGKIELNFLIPKKKRNLVHELLIKRRLKDYFQKRFQEKNKALKILKREGIFWFLTGALIMLGATFLYDLQGFVFKFLMIISEPAGWFMFWEGLGKVFMDAKEKQPDIDFYERMANSKVSFHEN